MHPHTLLGRLATRPPVQDRREAILYGGCMICTGDVTTADPSGADDSPPLLLRYSNVSDLNAVPVVTWRTMATSGFAQMPPRKGHALAAVGCDARDNKPASGILAPLASAEPVDSDNAARATRTVDESSDAGADTARLAPGCAVFVFGGWNPRWPEG